MNKTVGVLVYLVLRVSDLEASRTFYEQLGLEFTVELHGSGPQHYSTSSGSTVLELYPAGRRSPSRVRFGLQVPSAVVDRLIRTGRLERGATTVRDPDENEVDLVV